jgi:hypothetical protein
VKTAGGTDRLKVLTTRALQFLLRQPHVNNRPNTASPIVTCFNIGMLTNASESTAEPSSRLYLVPLTNGEWPEGQDWMGIGEMTVETGKPACLMEVSRFVWNMFPARLNATE